MSREDLLQYAIARAPVVPEDCQCRDGLRCRCSGEWARTKLQFLDDYVPIALFITQAMRRRWFVDLFAGPGRNMDRERNNSEFEGSPIRALRYYAQGQPLISFTDAIFVNQDPRDHAALNVRVQREIDQGTSLIPRNRIDILNEDSNQIIAEIMSQVPTKDYVFAFVDITGASHLPFQTIRELRRLGHESVDLYLLFPLEMTLIRKLAYEDEMTERYAADLTAFFDGEEWRAIRERRISSANANQLKRDVTELYLQKLREVWPYADVQHTIYRTTNRPLYKMIFASKNPSAKGIAKWQKTASQPNLF
jgi:three-Cys-motif partner protein